MSDDWLNIIRREAGILAAQQRNPLTLIVTSYNPNTYAVKGTLQPYGLETGWVPLATIGIGSGFGVLVGPNIGDQLAVEFENGDPNTPRATHRIFSNKDTPPMVQAGEVVIQAVKGQKITLDKDGKLTITVNGDTAVQVTGAVNIEASGALNIKGSTINLN